MKNKLTIIMSALFLISGVNGALAVEKAPQKIIDFANSTLKKLGTDPIIVAAVKAENKKGKTIEQIKEMDKKWINHAGIADYMQAMINSECGKYLLQIMESQSFYAEIFVMDNQGANVAMTDKTSDYWQGDEAKFQESFKGHIHFSDVEFDDSSQTYIVQISIPVKSKNKVIGAITVGIDVDKFN